MTVKETNLDQSGSLFRARLTNSAGTVLSREARLTVEPASSVPSGGLKLDKVTLDWDGSEELQKMPPSGGSNFFSAGVSDGNQGTYAAVAGNTRVLQASAGGAESLATWATRGAHISNGGKQLVRLMNGRADIEEDGSAVVRWSGAFSINFYEGRVPFTITDPVLTVDEDGVGTLEGDLSGYKSSMANPNQCEPLPPVADVTIATFSDVEIDPGGEVEIDPDYEGVEVTIPSGSTPQNRTATGWGAWPQEFVDFQLQTGLSSYWYSSGGAADPFKKASGFLVGFSGTKNEANPPVAPVTPVPKAQPQKVLAKVSKLKGTRKVSAKRLASIARLVCPPDGACKVTAPKKVKVTIDGKRYTLTVIAPRQVKAGRQATIRVKLTKAAAKALDGTAKVKFTIKINQLGIKTSQKLNVTIKG